MKPGSKTLGQVAYEGYFAACGGKSLISGAPLPSWFDQADTIKSAWQEAASCVVNIYKGGAFN